MNTTKTALLMVLIGLQCACELPGATTPGVRADGRAEGPPQPLSRPTSDPNANAATAPPPPPAAPPRRAAAPAPLRLKDSPCLSGLFLARGTPNKGMEQWALDDVRDHNLETGVGNMRHEVGTLLSYNWEERLANQDDLTGVRASIERIKEHAVHIRCLQADAANQDGFRLVKGLDVGEERVNKWATDVEAKLATEQTCRASGECMANRVGPQLCAPLADRREALQQIAAERANPAGVVSLSTLHDLGERVQIDNGIITRLKAQYVSLVHRPFNEASCPK